MSEGSTAQCNRTSRFSRFLQRAGEALSLRVIELHSGSDVHVGDVLDLGAQRLEHRRDFRQQAEPAVVREHGQEIAAVLVERAARGVRDQARPDRRT